MRSALAGWFLVLLSNGPAMAADVRVPRPGPVTAAQPWIAVDPAQPARLYVATEDPSEPPRLYRSDDGGATFVERTPPFAGQGGGPVLVLPDGTLLVGARDGVARSSDHGATWQMTGGACCLYDLVADPTNPAVVYGAGFGALIRSADGGATWGALPEPPGGQDAYVDLAVAATSPATIYLVEAYVGLFRSTDAGQSWSSLSSPTTEGALASVAVDPAQPSRLFLGTYEEGLFRSNDGGQAWTRLDLGVRNVQVFALAHDAAGTLYAGMWGWGPAVLQSADAGVTWADAAPALRDLHVRRITPHPATPGLLHLGTER